MRIHHLFGAVGAAVLLMPALAQAQPACDSRTAASSAQPNLRCVQHREWKGDKARYAGMGDFKPGTPREYDENHVQGGHYDANGVWADGEPLGYWDGSGVWHAGNITGYIDARGHWVQGSESSPN